MAVLVGYLCGDLIIRDVAAGHWFGVVTTLIVLAVSLIDMKDVK